MFFSIYHELSLTIRYCADGAASVGKASARRSCVDAFVIMLKSDEPWLLAQEDQLCRGLQELREPSLAQETIKRRRTYVINAPRRHLRALICEIPTGRLSTSRSKLCLSVQFPTQTDLLLFCALVTGSQHSSSYTAQTRVRARMKYGLHVRVASLRG